MANLTTRIGGQHYYKAADGNSESLLNFWQGTQTQYDQLKMTSATTSGAPTNQSSVTFTVTDSQYFAQGDVVYVTSAGYSGTGGATARVVGSISSIVSATSVIVAFTPNYSSTSTSGYQIDKYDPDTFYIITA